MSACFRLPAPGDVIEQEGEEFVIQELFALDEAIYVAAVNARHIENPPPNGEPMEAGLWRLEEDGELYAIEDDDEYDRAAEAWAGLDGEVEPQ